MSTTLELALARLDRELGAGVAESAVRLDPTSELLVVAPVSAAEVALAVRAGREAGARISIGGTAAADRRPRLHIDTRRLASLQAVDESSLLVQVEAGMRLDALSARLSAVGMSLGALPASSLHRSVGAVLAAPRPSEATPRGRLVELCAAMEVVLPDGTLAQTRLAPRKATGPDFLHAFIGAHGTTGVIVSAWFRAMRRPAAHAQAAYGFDSAGAALAAAVRLLDRGARPADLALGRLPSAAEAGGTVVLALAFDGTPEVVGAESALATTMFLGAPALGVASAERLLRGALPEPRAYAERFVLLSELPASLDALDAQLDPFVLRGLHPAGGALLYPPGAGDSTSAAGHETTTAASDGGSAAIRDALRAALAERLDPSGHFAPRASRGLRAEPGTGSAPATRGTAAPSSQEGGKR